MQQEQRKYMRLNAGGVSCTVKTGGHDSPGTVLDESIGGLRVGGVSLLVVSMNQPISVSYDGEVLEGVCRSVAREEGDLFSVGIRRIESTPKDEEPSAAILLCSFMEFGGSDLVCIPLESVDENQVKIMMIDGQQFVVDRKLLFSLTREERIERLCSETRFRNILNVYGLPDTENAFIARDQIVEHEFGPAKIHELAAV